jgi:hypothetical protein
MTDNNPWQSDSKQYGLDGDRLDRELDAALANYAAAEPREGIEERILANLRAERNHAFVRSWGWPAMGALAAGVVVFVLLLAVRFGKPRSNVTAHVGAQLFPVVTPPAVAPPAESHTAGNKRPGGVSPAPRKKSMSVAHPRPHSREDENASAPKLDVFPSPQPLSEQEKMLAAYVAQHERQAVLIAQARMEELKEDLAKEKELEKETLAPEHQPSDQSITR